MTFSRRLKAIEKRLVPRRLPRELKVHFVFADEFTPKDALRFDYMNGIHEDDTLIVEIVKTPKADADAAKVTTDGVTPDNGDDELTDELKAEIKRLEARRHELRAKAKA